MAGLVKGINGKSRSVEKFTEQMITISRLDLCTVMKQYLELQLYGLEKIFCS